MDKPTKPDRAEYWQQYRKSRGVRVCMFLEPRLHARLAVIAERAGKTVAAIAGEILAARHG